jgi:hypothetical protein
VRLEGLGQLKNPTTSSGIEAATFLFVEEYFNQLRYREVAGHISLTYLLKHQINPEQKAKRGDSHEAL